MEGYIGNVVVQSESVVVGAGVVCARAGVGRALQAGRRRSQRQGPLAARASRRHTLQGPGETYR